MDFGFLPPEVNSGRMYVGPGSASILSAAAAWDSLAGELHAAAASYESTLADLTAQWRGPSAIAMAGGIAPFVAWMTGAAVQAEQTAAQAKLAAAAYENAYTATVPPVVIAGNRSHLAALVATNLFGQNTAAIAATEFQYAEMWAQDAAAMYTYAAASAAASSLAMFQPPPTTTDQSPGALQPLTAYTSTASQAAPQLASSIAHGSAALAAADPPAVPFFTPAEIFYTGLTSFLNVAIGPLNPLKLYSPLGSFYDLAVQTFLAPFNNFNMQAAYGAALDNLPAAIGGTSGISAVGSAVSAEVGEAGAVGSLSVPASWAGSAPALASLTLPASQSGLGAVSAAPAADMQGSLAGNAALSGLAGRAVGGADTSMTRSGGGRVGAVPAETMTVTIVVIPED